MYSASLAKIHSHYIADGIRFLVIIPVIIVSLHAQAMIDSTYFRDSIPVSGFISDFEAEPNDQFPFPTRWYAFTDKNLNGDSRIDSGVVDPYFSRDGKYELLFNEKTGYGWDGFGPCITLNIGHGLVLSIEPYEDFFSKGFSGICCDLTDSVTGRYFDLTKYLPLPVDTSLSMFFSYYLDGDFDYFIVEVLDRNNDPDRINSKRKDPYYTGVWGKMLPASGAQWKHVEIPFISLASKQFINKIPPLDLQRLTKIRFTVFGENGQRGRLAIDNFSISGIEVKTHIANKWNIQGQPSAFSTHFCRKALTILHRNTDYVTTATVAQLFDLTGTLVQTLHLCPSGSETLNIPLHARGAGQYILRLNEHMTNGPVTSHCIPVTVFQ